MQKLVPVKWKRKQTGGLLIGAAIGTGLAARAAVRGGCDLLLALNAGRLRSMGAPSIASLLPLRDSNALVMDFGRAEILPGRGDVPVFFGACCFDPRQPIPALVDDISAAGFQGVTNFPTSIFLDGQFQAGVEAAGVGFAREVELLRSAHARGLLTLAYVATMDQARMMTDAGVDIINLNLGWNKGGHQGVNSDLHLAEAGEFARQVFQMVRRIRPTTRCMIEGGPIVSPEDMHRVCQASRADGYIGGSTIDRVPLEIAIEEAASSFKMAAALEQEEEPGRHSLRRPRDFGLVGWSEAIAGIRRQIPILARSGKPVLVNGPPGAGKELVARLIAAEARMQEFVCITCDEWAEESLFGWAGGRAGKPANGRLGLLESGGGVALCLKNPSRLPDKTQQRLLTAIESGRFLRLGDDRQTALTARLMFTETDVGRLSSPLRSLLASGEIELPPLRDRLEDLPLLTAHFLKARGRFRPRVESSVYRMLMAHDWPGNVRELGVVLERAVEAAGSQMLRPEHFPRLGSEPARPTERDEKEWILDALRRHRFRKAETADFLGISRKTLYNKMQRYQIATG